MALFHIGDTLIYIRPEHLSEGLRFLARVEFAGPDECWGWKSIRAIERRGRYATWNMPGSSRPEPAHRAAWRLFVEDVPADHGVMHKCPNHRCVNWTSRKHLDLSYDAISAKMTLELANELREARLNGARIADLSRRYRISPTFVKDIVNNERWRDPSRDAGQTAPPRCLDPRRLQRTC